MMRKSIRKIAGAVTALTITCLFAIGMAASAIAAGTPVVTGYDFYCNGDTGDSVTVLQVEGNAGDTIFVDVEQAGTRTAARLDYTLQSGDIAGVFEINVSPEQALKGVTVRAYANRTGTELLYQGSIYPVYANLDGKTMQLVALRTLAAGEDRIFNPEETLYDGATNYVLERDAAGNPVKTEQNGELIYNYKSYSDANTAGGSIKYIDSDGEVIYTQTIAAIPEGGSQAYEIPSVIEAGDGTVYRTIAFMPSVIASNPGQRDFVVRCVKLKVGEAYQGNKYEAIINLVDESGALLACATIDVSGKSSFTAPPEMFLTRDGKVTTYKLADKSQKVLNFDAEKDGVTGFTKTFTVAYETQPDNAPTVNVKYNLINATKTKKDGRYLGTDFVEVSAENPIALPPQETLLVDNGSSEKETYVIAGDPEEMYKYDFNDGGVPEINVYYVPENYEAPGPYDVTVQYVNLADNSVITTKTYESSPDQLSDLEITSDPSFDFEGASYVRLAGQEQPIPHNYYSGVTKYTVYYRNVNDDLTKDVVITRLRVLYDDVTATTETIETATGGTIADDATPLALSADGIYNVIAGAGTGLITNEAGVDSNTEFIEDAENPLAAASDLNGFDLERWLPFIIGGAAGILAVLVIVLVAVNRRRRASESGNE